MAQKRTRTRVNEALRPVAGSKKGPVSDQKQKELDQAEKADKQKTGSTAKSGPMKIESVDKFQQMLEYLVNEDTARAEDLFHEIVVEKSRQIYENLLQEEQDEEVDEADDEEVDESDDDELDESDDEDEDLEEDYYYVDEAAIRPKHAEKLRGKKKAAEYQRDQAVEPEGKGKKNTYEAYDEDDEEVDENFNLDEFEVEGEPEMDMDMGMMGGDAGDDMEMDMDDEEGDMDMDADMGGDEPVTQDDIKDLEAELADLKAEFEQMLAGEEEGDMDMDMDDEEGDMDMDDEEGDMDMDDEEGDMDMDDEEEMPEENFNYESRKYLSQAELMREYVNKIGGEQYHQYGKMGDNGTNTKSPVAGKNDMGGTTANILRADTEAGVEANKGNLHGNPISDQNPKDMSTGNVNVPGNKKAPAMKPHSAGHGAERKGKPESADKGAGSLLNGAPKRAK